MKTGAPTARKPGQGSRMGDGRLVRKEEPITRDRVVSDHIKADRTRKPNISRAKV